MKYSLVALLLLTGCASFQKPATEIGTISAGVYLPNLPIECQEMFAHADIKVGYDARVVLLRERKQLDKANSRIDLCAKNYQEVVKQYYKKETK